MACVYGLRAADDSLYFYVGTTKHSLEHRLKQHKDVIRLGRNRNRHLVNKINLVKWENVVADILVSCEDAERFVIETIWIQALQALGHPLTNIVHDTQVAADSTVCLPKDFGLNMLLSAASIYFRRDNSDSPYAEAIAKAFLKLIEDPAVYWRMINA